MEEDHCAPSNESMVAYCVFGDFHPPMISVSEESTHSLVVVAPPITCQPSRYSFLH